MFGVNCSIMFGFKTIFWFFFLTRMVDLCTCGYLLVIEFIIEYLYKIVVKVVKYLGATVKKLWAENLICEDCAYRFGVFWRAYREMSPLRSEGG